VAIAPCIARTASVPKRVVPAQALAIVAASAEVASSESDDCKGRHFRNFS